MRKGGLSNTAVICIVLSTILVIGGLFFYTRYILSSKVQSPLSCTQEAKQCPDGSYVGRTGSNCEFAQCPSVSVPVINQTENRVRSVSVQPGSIVTSPLEITGEAQGTWYFEASFPIKIYDTNGNLLGSTPAQAQSDWETEDFVPFKATLNFADSTTASGTLILERDNPSGLPANAGEYKIPVRFNVLIK